MVLHPIPPEKLNGWLLLDDDSLSWIKGNKQLSIIIEKDAFGNNTVLVTMDIWKKEDDRIVSKNVVKRKFIEEKSSLEPIADAMDMVEDIMNRN